MIDRRTILIFSGATLIAPAALAGDGFIDYTPGVIEDALADGKTVFVDYSATWCSTCKSQARTIAEIRAGNPAYDAAMIFVKVDWDTYSGHPVTTSRNIPRRSTLLVLKGNEELGRIVAGTARAEIEALLAAGLSAAG